MQSASQGEFCLDIMTSYHTEIEAADPTGQFYLDIMTCFHIEIEADSSTWTL